MVHKFSRHSSMKKLIFTNCPGYQRQPVCFTRLSPENTSAEIKHVHIKDNNINCEEKAT